MVDRNIWCTRLLAVMRLQHLGTIRPCCSKAGNKAPQEAEHERCVCHTSNYPLVNIQKTMENDHRNGGFSHGEMVDLSSSLFKHMWVCLKIGYIIFPMK